MKSLSSSLLAYLPLLLASFSGSAASDSSGSKDDLSPCAARSPTTGLYYDLSTLTVPAPSGEGQKSRQDSQPESWHVKGHDYNANFTLNICAPVVEKLKDVVGVEEKKWQNISAYYTKEGKVYSIGQQASDPFFRGRKLVMNYTDGSPCSSDAKEPRTKATMMSFLCDRDVSASQPTISFVGTMDQCTYFFEIRSAAACGGFAHGPAGQGLSPAGIFGVIALIAVAAYLVGGCAYQRTVMHQRGWRQCPNYSLWAGMIDFVKDMIVILFSSLARLLRFNRSPRLEHTRGGSRDGFIGGGRQGSGGDVDAENRLIDQLDEEWDD
ncbi:hypothetical protein P175DRAFT_0457815 [Aspergillus ochraceoroseus IBT 24754]|uniref:Vacuolar sorting receptor (Mrl1) n=2 Tax=Aspergillus subgen. Nidulantes TaxID=2720870 RepID=A0A0F8V622_9EURO|nr:uncharacterized protein P175DRAFT_0457815 [Aspergillus ochraceoroseus IBT 24754]KKK27193.1 vacuolar sorting receptor (Mrl1) [Aspergillus rambellii]PTU20496.1 hypothetical protein P175DRAFT_0457815 [Aspergillus ochraceoroseus IBT 24754]